jgi:FO synthase
VQHNLLASRYLEEIIERALEGKALTANDAIILFNSCSTDILLRVATELRNKTFPRTITYSRKVFLNVIDLCRDTCLYCTYKKQPEEPSSKMMKTDQLVQLAEMGKKYKCTEALIVTGERPEQRYQEAKQWLSDLGHSNLVDYLAEISEIILAKTGLFPHTNAGSLTKKEMNLLKQTNMSLGVMLENISERLTQPGMPHENAPSKHPKARIKTLRSAGELRIPMTTGLLVGIGETPTELVESLFAIRLLQEEYGHIQEVIMQNFAPKPKTAMAHFPPVDPDYFIRAVALSRIIMPKMNMQVPPNLNPGIYSQYISAGINDWGGISPLTIDHVNPEFAWPQIAEVEQVTNRAGRLLRARLPVYPEFLRAGFISERLRNYADLVVDSKGLVREDYLDAD